MVNTFRRRTPKYRDWAGEFIDSNLDGGAKAPGERNRDRDEMMLEPDFDPVPTAVQIGRCGYPAHCRAPRCPVSRATILLRKIDAAGRPVRQIELCDRHAAAVIAPQRNLCFFFLVFADSQCGSCC